MMGWQDLVVGMIVAVAAWYTCRALRADMLGHKGSCGCAKGCASKTNGAGPTELIQIGPSPATSSPPKH